MVVTERTFWLKGIFYQGCVMCPILCYCALRTLRFRACELMGCPLSPSLGMHYSVHAGQREEDVLCGMVASGTIPGRDAGASSPSSLGKVTDRLAFRGITGHGDYSTASQTFSDSDDLLVHTVGKHITCTIMIHLNSEIITGLHRGVIQGPRAYFHSVVGVWLAQWRPHAAVGKNMLQLQVYQHRSNNGNLVEFLA